MVVIDIKGNIVSNEYGQMYDYFGFGGSSVWPSKINLLLANATDDEIVLNIASDGGDVFAASEIYTVLKSSGKEVIANIQGLAASAASVIAMAGNKVNISPTAQIMIHKAMTVQSYGNADDLEHEATVLNGLDKSIATAYELKTGLGQTELLQLMAKETWMTAQDAVDKGFADSIMFIDQNKPIFSNAISQIPTAEKLNEFMNFMNYKSKHSNHDSKIIKNDKQADLRSRKLAILLEK